MALHSANRRLVVRGRIEECVSTECSCFHFTIQRFIINGKESEKTETTKGESKLRIVNPDAAGVDIADGVMQVCVPADRCEDNNREFKSFTCDLREISKWLKECRIQTVAMESTGVYWMSLYFMLQDDGFDVVLTNAKDIKKVTDRKTDESDAEWLMTLHQYGLLKTVSSLSMTHVPCGL